MAYGEARNVVDAGFPELVRLGVEPADDEVVRNSLSVVDETIRVETPNGPAWYRYNGDGEQGEGGEHPAGTPWSLDNGGQGRLWPIFTDERAEYAFGGGRDDDANPNVIGLVTPEGVDQSGALAYAADERATIPYPSLER